VVGRARGGSIDTTGAVRANSWLGTRYRRSGGGEPAGDDPERRIAPPPLAGSRGGSSRGGSGRLRRRGERHPDPGPGGLRGLMGGHGDGRRGRRHSGSRGPNGGTGTGLSRRTPLQSAVRHRSRGGRGRREDAPASG